MQNTPSDPSTHRCTSNSRERASTTYSNPFAPYFWQRSYKGTGTQRAPTGKHIEIDELPSTQSFQKGADPDPCAWGVARYLHEITIRAAR
jgi:hypothetical protein